MNLKVFKFGIVALLGLQLVVLNVWGQDSYNSIDDDSATMQDEAAMTEGNSTTSETSDDELSGSTTESDDEMESTSSMESVDEVSTETAEEISREETSDDNSTAVEVSVSGKVIDSKVDLPVVNAIISVKGTDLKAVADVNGKFSLKAGSEDVTLIVTALGYLQKEVSASSGTEVSIMLDKDILTLDKVVVVGYGTSKKSELTGAVTSVDTKALTTTTSFSVEEALQGQAAGVTITKNSGAPGKEASVRIRGVGTINNSAPLYVVDGVVMKSISNLSSSDIESMSILKDAASAAIYGNRGANGVILVTTKKGKEGKSIVTYDGTIGFQQPWKDPEMCTAAEYAEIKNAAAYKVFIEEGGNPADFEPYYDNPAALGEGTNWFKTITNDKAFVQNHSVSVSGGNEKNKYFIGGNYGSEEGIIKNTDFSTKGIRISNQNDVFKWLSLDTRLGVSQNVAHLTDEENEWENIIITALKMDPIATPYDADGEYGYSEYVGAKNPLAIVNEITIEDITTSLNASFAADFKIKDFITYKSSVGFDLKKGSQFKYKAPSDGIWETEGSLEQRYATLLEWAVENTILFNKKFVDIHSLKVLLGTSIGENSIDSSKVSGGSAKLVEIDMAELDNIEDASASGFYTYNRLLSYFGRLDYGLMDKYSLNASMRVDGSSKFPNNRYGYFPSVSGSWRVGEERFLDGLPVLSELKVRGGWGRLGNEGAVDDFAFDTLVEVEKNYVLGGKVVPGSMVIVAGNPDLKWEIQTSAGAGLDLGLLDNRLTITADFFNKVTDDMIVKVPVSALSGQNLDHYQPQNAASVLNRGFEATVGFKAERNKFGVDLSANISHYRNEVTSLGAGSPIYDGMIFDSYYTTKTDVGEAIGSFWGYKVKSVSADGEIVYVDKDGDGDPDQDYIGSPHPKFTYGFNAGFSYYGFDFGLFLQGSYGNQLFNVARMVSEDRTVNGNVTKSLYDAWKSGDNSNGAVSEWAEVIPSDLYVEDASYMRIKSLRLGYTIPSKIVEKIHISKLRIYFGADNLWTFTKYSGLDPEIGEGEEEHYEISNPGLCIGVDRGVYPQSRTFVLGLNLTL